MRFHKSLLVIALAGTVVLLGFLDPHIKGTWAEVATIALGCAAYIALAIYLIWSGFSRSRSRASRIWRGLLGSTLIIGLIVPIITLPLLLIGFVTNTHQFFLAPLHMPYLGRMVVAQYENIQHYRNGNVLALDVRYRVDVGNDSYTQNHTVYCTTRSRASITDFKNDFRSYLYRSDPIAVSSDAILKTDGSDLLIADNRNQLCQRAMPDRRFMRGRDRYELHYHSQAGGSQLVLDFELEDRSKRVSGIRVYEPEILSQRVVRAKRAIELGDLRPFRTASDEGKQIPLGVTR